MISQKGMLYVSFLSEYTSSDFSTFFSFQKGSEYDQEMPQSQTNPLQHKVQGWESSGLIRISWLSSGKWFI